MVMFNCYCATCFLLKYAVVGELFEGKQQFKFGVVIIVCRCIKSVEETDQNKPKKIKNE